MIYPDTSILIAAATREVNTAAALELLGSAKSGELLASDWTETEIASALGVKQRSGQIDGAGRLRAAGVLRSLLTDSFTVLPVTTRHFRLATELMERDAAPLKAPDALHLAIAILTGAVLWTGDVPMFRAARALGLQVERLG